ncbi:hypothetical protein Curi_c02350 [Gottschalkia acidurici 9a]|uniref:Uncharacterized protein n=1 Tax=Gottschalkia acidurici (strain ATCC 7906 / DSM 604 / BCRC 14475 / CIP 104303 / KCTC 5404 / NCIMB 10678 / 9a) TaxID=1128398 RepID=K0AX40_GOTA9|nr:hypothetical protein Curi_c02350 [Gottschalkia acidurici 9a]
MKEYYKNGIMALIPTYIEMIGDSTKVITKNSNEYYIYKSIRAIINLLARYNHIDLKETRRFYGNKIGCKNLIPIPFSKENIFAPIKVRAAISKNDSSFGYINIKYIEKIKEKDELGVIYLNDGVQIDTYQRLETVEKHIRNGKLVESIYNGRGNVIVSERNIDFYQDYNTPATKGDIAALRNDILYMIKEVK